MSQPRTEFAVPKQPWLNAGAGTPFFVNNLKLLLARWMVHESMFDEALEQLSGLKPKDVVAPASLLFYQSIAAYALLDKESGLKSMDNLLRGDKASPRRYVVLAQLMQGDLGGLKEETLDHVARRMEDIRRRLDLGRAGKKVVTTEDGVIKSLDKIIDELEKQQDQDGRQARQGRGKSPGKSLKSSQPMQDSHDRPGQGAWQCCLETYRPGKRLGRSAAQGARRSHAGGGPRFPPAVSAYNRGILPAAGRRIGRNGRQGRGQRKIGRYARKPYGSATNHTVSVAWKRWPQFWTVARKAEEWHARNG